MDATSTVLGWSVLLLSGGGLYWYYTKGDKNKRSFKTKTSPAAARVASKPSTESRPARDRRRDERRSTGVSEPDVRKRQNAQSDTAPQVQSSAKGKDEKEDLSWARELADKQKGTTLSAPSRNESRQKTIKQGKANNKAAQMTPSSSTTGGDADDDLSPAVSPPLPAIESEAFPSGNDVSDMLEPSAPAPGTLRITEPANGKSSKPKREQKPATPQETKKDRQNKKKAEEKKLQREADEKARRALEEKQRRTAREARGEPAKNGLAPASAPSSNAWKESQHADAPVPTANRQLLDTLANENQKVKTTNGSKANGDKWWSGDIPSEEEQVRILTEQDDSSWNTVVTKKGKKKGKAAEGSVSDSASDAPAPAVQAPVLEKSKPSYSNGTFAALHDDGEDGWEVA
jgi:hypothetical protein